MNRLRINFEGKLLRLLSAGIEILMDQSTTRIIWTEIIIKLIYMPKSLTDKSKSLDWVQEKFLSMDGSEDSTHSNS